MIKIKLNDDKYAYEVYNVFHLFFENISFAEEEENYEILVCDDNLEIIRNNKKEKFPFDSGLTNKENIKRAIFSYLSKDIAKDIPWGTLVGIRPSKIALKLLKEGYDKEEIVKYFNYHSLTREDKAKLCIDVAKKEEKIVNRDQNTISVYIGMPFCPTRCLYCSFISDTINNCKDVIEQYLQAMCYEMDILSKYIKEKGFKIECVYFGGGTPTSITNEQFEKVMENVFKSFVFGNNIKEFTVECGRPDSISKEKLSVMKKYGVHRISINPQTMNDETLKLIGRGHDSFEVKEKFKLAREMGFNNINVDIIVGLPSEGLKQIEYTCNEILKLEPDSLTVHGMSLKRGSKLHHNVINNIAMKIAPHEELNKMYEATEKLARELKLEPYYMYRQKNMVGNMENVGYSKSNKEGIYNIQMIEERQTIIAIGANAVSKAIFLNENRVERFPNIKDVREYIKRIDEKVESKIKFLDNL